MTDDEITKRVVVFIDSLGNDDLKHMPWLRDNMKTGEMHAGPVFVTPVVLGSIYTGTSPTTHGLPSISRHKQPSRLRPAGLTIPEIAANTEKYENVVQLGLPFITPPNVDPKGNYWHISQSMSNQAVMPADAESSLSLPAPAGKLDMPDENLDLAFNLRVDHCMMTFGLARNLLEMWDADLMFISYRVTDSYCHYHYTQPEGEEKSYRDMILEQVDRELKYLSNQAHVMVFGDHGARELTEVFRVNRWLMEHGYLDVEIDEQWRERAFELGVIEKNEDVPGEVLNPDSPGVVVNEDTSVAIGADPFSTGVTLLDGATEERVEDLIDELGNEDAISEVKWTTDLYGHGPLEEECPELYALREPGVFVSGNLADELGGAELTRDGVHHPIGAYGATVDVDPSSDQITPEDLFYVIADEFLGLDLDAVETEDFDSVAPDERDVRQHLEDMGYI